LTGARIHRHARPDEVVADFEELDAQVARKWSKLPLLTGASALVVDDSRTMLSGGLAPQRLSPLRARTSAYSFISTLPFTL
jgi:hypothetical protein